MNLNLIKENKSQEYFKLTPKSQIIENLKFLKNSSFFEKSINFLITEDLNPIEKQKILKILIPLQTNINYKHIIFKYIFKFYDLFDISGLYYPQNVNVFSLEMDFNNENFNLEKDLNENQLFLDIKNLNNSNEYKKFIKILKKNINLGILKKKYNKNIFKICKNLIKKIPNKIETKNVDFFDSFSIELFYCKNFKIFLYFFIYYFLNEQDSEYDKIFKKIIEQDKKWIEWRKNGYPNEDDIIYYNFMDSDLEVDNDFKYREMMYDS